MSPIVDNELELYRNAFLYDSVGKAIVDLNGDWIKVNPAYSLTIGYDEAELLETNFYDLFFADHPVELLNEIFENDNEHIELELHFHRQHKNPLWILMNITLVGIANKPRYFTVQVLDITARKEYERKIHRMNMEINLILDSVQEGIYGIDHNSGAIYWNLAAERLTGYKRDEISPVTILHLLHHTDKEGKSLSPEDCSITHAIINGKPLLLTDEILWRKDGSSFPVEIAVNPVMENGLHTGTVMTFTDISEREKSKELLVRSEKLSMAGQLAAGIAHEIRNPLTSLKGFIRLIQAADSPSKTNYYLTIMDDELNRIEQILNELLLLAKPQSVHFNKTDLAETLKQIVALLQPQALLKSIELLFELQAEQTEIYCDPNQIKQVIINLIKNAVEASDNDKRITIVLCSEPSGVSIMIRDEGPGIPPELMHKLGEPFVTTKEKGTGLGLMVSYTIIRNHQGEIEVASTVGQGTTFIIKLPYEQLQPA